MQKLVYALLACLVVICCKKESIPDTPALTKEAARRKLFIPQSDWNGKLKKVTVYHYSADTLSSKSVNQFYYSDNKIAAQCFQSDYITNPDSSILLYNEFQLQLVNINYDDTTINTGFSKIFMSYNYDSTTHKIKYLNHQFPADLLANVSSVFLNYNGSVPTGFISASGNIDNIYITPMNNTIEISNNDSLVVKIQGAYSDYIVNSYLYSVINNPLALNIINSVTFFSAYGFDTYGFVFPYYQTGYDEWFPLTKLPEQKIISFNNTSFTYATHYRYQMLGSAMNSIVIETPLSATRDSLAFSYY